MRHPPIAMDSDRHNNSDQGDRRQKDSGLPVTRRATGRLFFEEIVRDSHGSDERGSGWELPSEDDLQFSLSKLGLWLKVAATFR